MATRRANHAATASPATAKRGRLSERAWSDVLRAARIARAEGVALRVHGIEIYNKRKPQKLKNKVLRREQKKPTETVAPTLPSTANGVKPPPPHSKRQQRSALRLQDFQEKKRAAAVQDFVTQGADPVVAQEKVPTFALGILTQSLQNLGFEAAPKERMMLTARLPLRNGDHPSQDSLRKLKKWRPPWHFLFS